MAAGLLLGRAGADGPDGPSATYNREVVRVLERRCLACHDTGSAIPLATYVDARPWARAIREEVLERRMPPWPVAHGVRPLANDLNLTPREIAAFVSWADGGAPRGDPADLPRREARPAWPAGPPTTIVPVAAEGAASVVRVALPVTAARARWVRGFDLRPAGPDTVRAAFLYRRGADGAEEWLGGWTPWHAMPAAPAGAAARWPAGTALVLEVHRAGSAPLLAELGLYLAEAPPAEIVRTVVVPGAADGPGRARGTALLPAGAALWAVRARSEAPAGPFEVSAVRPDGSVEPLLWITDHASAWPSPYVLEEPARLPAGSTLRWSAYSRAGRPAPAGALVEVLAVSAAAPPPR